jgi:hypothetical protein
MSLFPATGMILDSRIVERPLAKGGLRSVYRVRELSGQAQVAVKEYLARRNERNEIVPNDSTPREAPCEAGGRFSKDQEPDPAQAPEHRPSPEFLPGQRGGLLGDGLRVNGKSLGDCLLKKETRRFVYGESRRKSQQAWIVPLKRMAYSMPSAQESRTGNRDGRQHR